MRKLQKGIVIALAVSMSMALLTGCSSDSKKETGSLKNTATSTDGNASGADEMSQEEYIEFYGKPVKLGDYKGLKYTYDVAEVTDDEVDTNIQDFVDGLATYDEDKESAAKDGDTVNIDFVGTIDGVEFEGGNTNGAGYDLTIGSGSFIDNFEDQVVGHKAGDQFVVKVTFPDDYGKEELNGKEAEFNTTVNYIKITKEATLSDELVAANTDYDTVADYKQFVRESLEQNNEDKALADAQNLVMTAAIANATIDDADMSADEIKTTADNIIASLKSTATNYGFDYETYVYYYYGYEDTAEFEQYVNEVAADSMREKMTVCAIALKEGMSVNADEIAAATTTLAKNNQATEEDVTSNYSENEIMYYALSEKVMNFLMDNAVKTDSEE